MSDAKEILDNVIWLVEALNEEALGEVGDIPLLEMAKSVVVAPLPVGFTSAAQSLEKRALLRYPTGGRALLKRAV